MSHQPYIMFYKTNWPRYSKTMINDKKRHDFIGVHSLVF